MGVWGEGIEGKRKGRREDNGKREQESERWTKMREREAREQARQLSGPPPPLSVPVSFVLLCTLNWFFSQEFLSLLGT